jgi:hypothetical protein
VPREGVWREVRLSQIVVERAMYSDANGVVWAAGTDALATKATLTTLSVSRPREGSILHAAIMQRETPQPIGYGADGAVASHSRRG